MSNSLLLLLLFLGGEGIDDWLVYRSFASSIPIVLSHLIMWLYDDIRVCVCVIGFDSLLIAPVCIHESVCLSMSVV